MVCSTRTAMRSSRILRPTVSAVAGANALCGSGEDRISTFFTYCWASVEPPCTVLCSRLLTSARVVIGEHFAVPVEYGRADRKLVKFRGDEGVELGGAIADYRADRAHGGQRDPGHQGTADGRSHDQPDDHAGLAKKRVFSHEPWGPHGFRVRPVARAGSYRRRLTREGDPPLGRCPAETTRRSVNDYRLFLHGPCGLSGKWTERGLAPGPGLCVSYGFAT